MTAETQSAIKPEYGTLFIPTPGVEECRNYHLVQKLLESRIRAIMTEESFVDASKQLVRQFLLAPPELQTAVAIDKYMDEEAHELYNSFTLYETSPLFQNGLETLVPYKGMQFRVNSMTLSGFQMIIDLTKD